MSHLDLSESTLLERGALHTAREIAGQPALWLATMEKFNRQSPALLSFLKTAIAESTQIVLTGAGTSAYIGLSLQGVFSSRMNKISRRFFLLSGLEVTLKSKVVTYFIILLNLLSTTNAS